MCLYVQISQRTTDNQSLEKLGAPAEIAFLQCRFTGQLRNCPQVGFPWPCIQPRQLDLVQHTLGR